MIVDQTSIIPINQRFYNEQTNKLVSWEVNAINNLDLKAIASFCSLGFMLDNDTFYNDIKVLQPSTKITLNNSNSILSREKTWEWHYNPIERPFEEILDEFTNLINRLVLDKVKDRSILLPISGGIDSRTLFVPVKYEPNLTLSAYEFEGGHNETMYGMELAERFSIPFYAQKIPKGYLWNKLDELHQLNNCFSEFTHPRQLAVLENWKGLGSSVLLGHMGDLLFESQIDTNNYSYNEQLFILKRKVLKPGGSELASDLWKYWGFEQSFETYITDRLDKLYRDINIDHPSARIRAFKSLYWVPRLSSIGLSIFQELGELVLPYYSDEMCKFICTVPERHLEGRKIQIEYIKKHCPEAAQIPWQKYYPLNLYQHKWFSSPVYYPVRAMRKVNRFLLRELFKYPKLITRNWELQFLGEKNFLQLKKNLMERSKFNELIPQKIIMDYLDKFEADPVKYAHSLSMLLTLAVFSSNYHQK